MELNFFQKFIVENSETILASVHSPAVPEWIGVLDDAKPARRSNYNLVTEAIGHVDSHKIIEVGDKLQTFFTTYPQVRLDGNVVVRFSKGEIQVVRESDKKKALITGLPRLFYIQKAKAGLGKDCVKIEISAIYECINISPYSLCPLKTVGDITIKQIKL